MATKLKRALNTNQSIHLMTLIKEAFENVIGKEKMLVTSFFFIAHNFFYPVKDDSLHLKDGSHHLLCRGQMLSL